MSAVVYIIPGFREQANSKVYRNVAAGFRKQKINPVRVSIRWQYASMSDYINQFVQQVGGLHEKNYLLGFSFGAMIAFVAAPYLKPVKLFLCSLSPFFKEDLPALSSGSRKSLGIKRLRDFSNYSFNELAKKITCETFIFNGEHELPSVLDRSTAAHKAIQNSRLLTVKDVDHDFDHPNYQREVLKIIQRCR